MHFIFFSHCPSNFFPYWSMTYNKLKIFKSNNLINFYVHTPPFNHQHNWDNEHFNHPQRFPPHTPLTGFEMEVCVQIYLGGLSGATPVQEWGQQDREELGLNWDAEMTEGQAQPTPHGGLQSCPTLRQGSPSFVPYFHQSLDMDFSLERSLTFAVPFGPRQFMEKDSVVSLSRRLPSSCGNKYLHPQGEPG